MNIFKHNIRTALNGNMGLGYDTLLLPLIPGVL